MGLREKKKKQTRRAIVGAAIRLFNEQGYEATTFDQIAEAAEVGRRTIFRYFPSKESLLLGGDQMDPQAILREFKNRLPGEDDVQLVTRVMSGLRAKMFDLDPEQNIATHKLVRSTPALAAQSYLLILSAEDLILQALAGENPEPTEEQRIRVLAGAVIIAIDTAVTLWIEGGMQSDLDELIRSLTEHLRTGFSRT